MGAWSSRLECASFDQVLIHKELEALAKQNYKWRNFWDHLYQRDQHVVELTNFAQHCQAAGHTPSDITRGSQMASQPPDFWYCCYHEVFHCPCGVSCRLQYATWTNLYPGSGAPLIYSLVSAYAGMWTSTSTAALALRLPTDLAMIVAQYVKR